MITTETIKANISFDLLAQAKLNDFDAFNRALFTEEKWKELGMKCFEDYYFEFLDLIVLPYKRPKKMVEFQINHYIMWGVISHFQRLAKPDKVIFLNEMKVRTFVVDELKPWTKYIRPLNGEAIHGCWACEFTTVTEESESNIFCDCDFCPIWDGKELTYACEFGCQSPYYKWVIACDKYNTVISSNRYDDDELKYYREQATLGARELMTIPWNTHITYEEEDLI